MLTPDVQTPEEQAAITMAWRMGVPLEAKSRASSYHDTGIDVSSYEDSITTGNALPTLQFQSFNIRIKRPDSG